MAPIRNYTAQQMASAIQKVKQGSSISAAASLYGVPRITLRNKITGKTPEICRLGPATILTSEEEDLLKKWIFYMADHHFPVTRNHLLDSVQKIISNKNLQKCPFVNNRPGKKWFHSFLKRHPEISQRFSQNLTKSRDDVTEDEIVQWFATNKAYLESRGLLEALNDPSRIFNTDESAFFLQPKAGSVLVRKGEKNVYSKSGDEKENLTVLMTGNAAGVLAPPMIVFPYERLPPLISSSVPGDWGIGRSETGWMTSRTFYEYMTNIFNPWLETNKVPKPVIFFLDGHRSHMTLHLAEFCKNNGIEIIALHPNPTHLLQPMDVAVFKPLKTYWKNQVAKWKTENSIQQLKKANFAPNLQVAIEKLSPDTIKNGFRKSGLFPFGPEYVDVTKISAEKRILPKKNNVTEQANFVETLESEITRIFSQNKLTLFNQMYWLQRTDVENLLPNEDLSLYVIWSKNKNTVLDNSLAATHTDGRDIIQNSNPQIEQSITNPESEAPYETRQVCVEESGSQEKPPQEYEIPHELPQAATHTDGRNIIQNSNLHTEQSSTSPESEVTNETRQVCVEESSLQEKPPQEPEISHELPQQNVFQPSQQNLNTHESDEAITAHQTAHMTPSKTASTTLFTNNHTSADYITPTKNVQDNRCYPSTSTLQPFFIPSPFKRALYWPEPETKKRRIKERLPSAVTSNTWMAYMKKKENEKKQKQEEKEKRMKAREEKKMDKEQAIQKKKNNTEKTKKSKKSTKKIVKQRQVTSSSSSDEMETDIEYQESACDEEFLDDYHEIEEYRQLDQPSTTKCGDSFNESRTRQKNTAKSSESGSDEDVPLNELRSSNKTYRRKQYVIVRYEGSYFPGLIDNIHEGQYEISTMILSKGNSFRWPDTPDKIWYKSANIVEHIEKPISINKRGFYKVKEMDKYLPYLFLERH